MIKKFNNAIVGHTLDRKDATVMQHFVMLKNLICNIR